MTHLDALAVEHERRLLAVADNEQERAGVAGRGCEGAPSGVQLSRKRLVGRGEGSCL